MLYQVVVVAFNSRGNGAANKPQSFYCQELIPTQSVQNVMFDRSGEYVGISWDALTLSEARGFPVYTVTLTPSTSTSGVISMNTSESSIVIGGLDTNSEYMLTVEVGTTAGQVMSDRGNQYSKNYAVSKVTVVVYTTTQLVLYCSTLNELFMQEYTSLCV